jgi:hypothetical protein
LVSLFARVIKKRRHVIAVFSVVSLSATQSIWQKHNVMKNMVANANVGTKTIKRTYLQALCNNLQDSIHTTPLDLFAWLAWRCRQSNATSKLTVHITIIRLCLARL